MHLLYFSGPLSWILSSICLTALIQSAFFLVAYRLQSDLLTDIAAAINFFVLALLGALGCHRNSGTSWSLRVIVLVICTTIWSMRLGIFQLLRIWGRKRDARFDPLRSNFRKFGAFWMIQGAWVLSVSLPLILLNGANALTTRASFGFLDLIGLLLWIAGFLLETLADHQKHLFSLIPRADRPVPFVTTGLWSHSRHPNYFGEIVLWVGFWISAAWGISGWSWLAALISAVGPLSTLFILVKVTGIPVAESRDDHRYGKLLAYQQYKAITSPLFPVNPRLYAYVHPRIKRSFFLETNTIPIGQFALPKFKAGSPIQYSTQSFR